MTTAEARAEAPRTRVGGQPRSLEDAVAAPGYEVAHTFHVRPGYDLATEAAMRGLFEEEPTLTLGDHVMADEEPRSAAAAAGA